MEDHEKLLIHLLCILFLTILLATVAALITHLNKEICEKESAKTLVIGIKSASVGGNGYHERCVYVTEVGDIIKKSCEWDVGDMMPIRGCY